MTHGDRSQPVREPDPRVFLCYRNTHGGFVAAALRQRLVRELGDDNVVYARENFDPAPDIPEALGRAIRACDVLLVVIHPRWEEETDGRGGRRLEDPRDYVRLEIETALGLDMPILPVLLEPAVMPREADLPPSLQALATRNGSRVQPEPELEEDVGPLLERIRQEAKRYRRCRQILHRLQATWQRGEWVRAYRELREALDEPEVERGSLRKRLLEMRELAVLRAQAARELEASLFESALQRLRTVERRGPADDVTLVAEIARIGVEVCDEVDSGPPWRTDELERRFRLVVRECAVRKMSTPPGGAQVRNLLGRIDRLKEQIWRARYAPAERQAIGSFVYADHFLTRIEPVEVVEWEELLDLRPRASDESSHATLKHSHEARSTAWEDLNLSAPGWLSLWKFLLDRLREEGDLATYSLVKSSLEQGDGGTGPTSRIDRLLFSVTAPAVVTPGSRFVLDVWAHLDDQRAAVVERARDNAQGPIKIRTEGPVRVETGSILTVELKLEGLVIESPYEKELHWQGDAANAGYSVTVPEGAAWGSRHGLATVHLHGLRVASLPFVLEVGSELSELSTLLAGRKLLRTAFACYAREDLDQVLARIQGMQKVAPWLDVFLDVVDLRSGAHWQEELKRVIPERDVFYLFWSGAASRSPWVETEWRCALEARGQDFIDPVPLVSPREVPPPAELADRHFDDWMLAYMRRGAAHEYRPNPSDSPATPPPRSAQ